MSQQLVTPEGKFVERVLRLGLFEAFLAVGARYGATLEEIGGPSRAGHVKEARHECMAIAKRQLNWSLPCVGGLFRRDHTTVMSAMKKLAARSAATSSIASAAE